MPRKKQGENQRGQELGGVAVSSLAHSSFGSTHPPCPRRCGHAAPNVSLLLHRAVPASAYHVSLCAYLLVCVCVCVCGVWCVASQRAFAPCAQLRAKSREAATWCDAIWTGSTKCPLQVRVCTMGLGRVVTCESSCSPCCAWISAPRSCGTHTARHVLGESQVLCVCAVPQCVARFSISFAFGIGTDMPPLPWLE